MPERFRRRGTPPRPVAPKPVTARAPEAAFLGWREIRTFLDPGTQVSGKLNFSTPTRIEGRLRGEVRANDLLVVAEGGSIHGTVWARTLIVAGEVRGQILGADKVEVQPGGRVYGLIEARELVVPDGAIVEADCRLGADPAHSLDSSARG
jgi:cytoskeletal protein CcmA (bactofilin family)